MLTNRNRAFSVKVPLFCTFFFVLSCLIVSSVRGGDADIQGAMRDARDLVKADRYGEAEAILKEVLRVEPANQKATLLLGLNQRFAGRYDEAVQTLLRAVELKPGTYEAGQALFICAKAHFLAGRPVEARKLIARMRAEYPDSGWLSQADVLENTIDGVTDTTASAALARENAGEAEYKRAIDQRTTAGIARTLSAMQAVAERYRGLPVGLQACESVGNLLAASGETTGALMVFSGLLHELGERCPQSRIVQTAHTRLGALYQRIGDPRQAIEHYMASANPSLPNADTAQNALLQAGGVTFELLQQAVRQRNRISASEWESLRCILHNVRSQSGASTNTIVRSDLMELESYLWSGQRTIAIDLGTTFIATYGSLPELRRETATACVTLSRCCKELFRYPECVRFARQALALYPTEESIWPGMDHIERAYCDLVEALFVLGEDSTAETSLKEFAERFPQSEYLKAIQLSRKANFYRTLHDNHLAGSHAQ